MLGAVLKVIDSSRLEMPKPSYYKALFLIGGIWNIGGALLSWLGAVLVPDMAFASAGMSPPDVLFPYHAMYSFIVTFGIGYIIVSRDITRNHGIVVLGIIGKTLFFIACATAFASKVANIMVLLTGMVDILFACLFLEFLFWVKKGAIQEGGAP